MKDIASAVAVVRKTHSRESAKAIVNYFQEQQQYKPVIEFCIVAGLDDEAFAIAQQNDEMGFYAGIVKNDATYERCVYLR